jgi:hypothetical protein
MPAEINPRQGATIRSALLLFRLSDESISQVDC